MDQKLSPARLKSARSSYYIFNLLNSFSFVFVSGSFITLFALSLGAGNSFIGLLNALGYATFFFLPVGKRLVKNFPIVKIFGYAWVGRYLAMVPALLAPVFAATDKMGTAFSLILASVAGFNIMRGIALIGNNPVLSLLGGEENRPGSDRGAFLLNVSILNSIAGTAGSLVVALLLGKSASPWIYALSIAGGIVVGLIGISFLFRTPEPDAGSSEDAEGLISITIKAMADPPFRLFISNFVLLALTSGMARSFLPTYAKEVYGQGDNAIMLFSLAGSLGSVAMGLLIRKIVDRLGSKPLLLIFIAMALVSLAPVALLPGEGIASLTPAIPVMLLAALNFFIAFAFAGSETMGQSYYFSLVPKDKMLDLSVVYFFAYGLGGAVGSGTGGILLDLLESGGVGEGNVYRIFYASLIIILGYALYRMKSLKHMGSSSVRESLGVMFSLRDLKAFDLLSRLDQSGNPDEDARIIHEIGESASSSSVHPLQQSIAQYLVSPRFAVRVESLRAIENMDTLDPEINRILVTDVRNHPFTTAYISARILGRIGGAEAIQVLREAIDSGDYMLQATSVVSLAKLKDRDSRVRIEKLMTGTSTPRVRISAALALEILGEHESIPALVSTLKRDDPPAFVSDEVVMALATILGIMGSFYPLYKLFSEDETAGLEALGSAARESERKEEWKNEYIRALDFLFAPAGHNAAPMSAIVLMAGMDPSDGIVLSEAILDPELSYRGFRFLVAACPVLTGSGQSGTRFSSYPDPD